MPWYLGAYEHACHDSGCYILSWNKGKQGIGLVHILQGEENLLSLLIKAIFLYPAWDSGHCQLTYGSSPSMSSLVLRYYLQGLG